MRVPSRFKRALPATHNRLRQSKYHAIQDAELLRNVGEASRLSVEQKTKLCDVLLRYKKFFTSKPGRCNLLQYGFKVTPEEPLVGHSRPIPFAVRSAARAQIKQMLEDKIIEP